MPRRPDSSAMSSTKPKSVAEKEAEARQHSVLLNYAYLYSTAKGTLQPEHHRKVRPELLAIFEELVEAAAKYKSLTGRHLPILGELGELFAEIMFGIERHTPMARGSDGKIGRDLIEIKTITPDKKTSTIQVKHAGNFGKLVVVKISDDFQFAARMVDRGILTKGKGRFAELSWDAMVANERNQEIHQNFPIQRAPSENRSLSKQSAAVQLAREAGEGKKNGRVNRELEISKHLDAVYADWLASRGDFPLNTSSAQEWPIPFFGNPRRAVVATVGVNPSAGEFHAGRNWTAVQSTGGWKSQLKDYFNRTTPPHRWFDAWRAGLPLLGVSYEAGSAVHLDVSYRSTTAMVRNSKTDPKEFRRMAERDVQWFFRLLPLCDNLRLLLTFGPIIRGNGRCQGLLEFLRDSAPRHGFKVFQDRGLFVFEHRDSGRSFFAHDVSDPRAKDVVSTVLNNLRSRHERLAECLTP
jgi:hypothetical protein